MVDKKTGEIVSRFPEVRSQAFPGSFQDHEGDFPPSIVDSSNYEELSTLVNKLTRGADVMISTRNPVYEVGGDVSPLDAIRDFDETRRDGFDLADAAVIMRKAEEEGARNVEERKKRLAAEQAQLKKDEADLKAFRNRQKELFDGGEALGDAAKPQRNQEPAKPAAEGK